MIDGIIAAMKALEIVVVVNIASTEGEVMAEVFGKERTLWWPSWKKGRLVPRLCWRERITRLLR
jgi:hypothetical protein